MAEKPKILVVDDEESHRIMLKAVLGAEGYAVAEAADGTEAVEAVGKEAFDVILLDIRMTNMDGIEALGEIRKISPQVPVLIMTAYASVKTAVEALKAGAFDYLTKPLDIEELKILIEKAMDHYHLRAENLVLKERLGDRFDFSRIIATSPKMKALLETLAMVAPSDATVLIMGESGTGKEVVANAIHHNSPRAGEPFIKVACAALPETLLESELFGHEKGAFTGAVARREGRFQLAHRGTIFLDEVGEMSPAIQTKLLRVLQEKEFEPLGSTRTIKVDIRVIAATNRDLEKDVKEGRFREDLYYRLNVVPLTLPPLAGTPGGCPSPCGPFPGPLPGKEPEASAGHHREGARSPRPVRLAGEHPGVGERDRAGRNPLPRRGSCPGRSAAPDPDALPGRGEGCLCNPGRDESRRDGAGADRQDARRDRRQPYPGFGDPRHQPPDPPEQTQTVRAQRMKGHHPTAGGFSVQPRTDFRRTADGIPQAWPHRSRCLGSRHRDE